MAELMNTREVAEYLRLKERKIYDLVREKRIPCTRVTGKWLFPKRLVDAWLAKGPRFPRRSGATPPAPPVITAAMIRCWSGACANPAATWRPGRRQPRRSAPLRRGEAMVCALHVVDPASGEYNLRWSRRWAPTACSSNGPGASRGWW